jgi:PBSX family phage terminase large subunit
MPIEINFSPTLKQKYIFDLFDDELTTEIIWGGSVGGGKSYALGALMVMKCLQFKGIRIGLARNSITNLKKTTVISIMEVLNHWGLKPDEHFTYNSQAGIIKFFNGSEIILVELQFLPSDPQYARLGGLLLTFIVIDEMQECDEMGKSVFQTRAGRWKNNETNIKPLLIGTCNPSKTSFLYRNYYLPFKEGTLREYQKFIQVLPEDNTYLPKSYIENLKKTLSLNERRRLLQGEWELEDDPSSLFKSVDIQNIYDTSVILTTDKVRRLSADIAFASDKCVLVIWEGLNILKIITHIKTTDLTLIDNIKGLMVEYQIRTDNITWDADGVGKFLKEHFPGGKEIHNNGKTIVEHGYINLKTELYFKLSELISNGMIKCFDKSLTKEIDEELSVIKHKPKENLTNKIELISKLEMKRFLGRSPDYADALAYGMLHMLKNSTMSSDDFVFINF